MCKIPSKRSPKHTNNFSTSPIPTKNRFNGLEAIDDNNYDQSKKFKSARKSTHNALINDKLPKANEKLQSATLNKPPPIFIRKKINTEIIVNIKKITRQFFMSTLMKGKIEETKVQVHTIDHYRKLTKYLEDTNCPFYSFQLKCERGKIAIIKGIDSSVDPQDIKNELLSKGFPVKQVNNILNSKKMPMPLFKVEFNPGYEDFDRIFDLEFLLDRKIYVEPPRKKASVVQCHKCQEYGHTKSYCKLVDVCVICGLLHASSTCPNKNNFEAAKHCSNCNGNHTANFKGCIVYQKLKQKLETSRNIPRQQPPKEFTYNEQDFVPLIPTDDNPQPIKIPTWQISGQSAPASAANQPDVLSPALTSLSNTIEKFIQSIDQKINLLIESINSLLKIVAKTLDG